MAAKPPLERAVCDATDAHCEWCRDELRGPALAAQWAEVFEFEAEADGRPVCLKKRTMGWKRTDPKPPLVQITVQRPPPPPRPAPKVTPEVAAARLAKCNACPGGHNVRGSCRKMKEKYPNKSASIARGVLNPSARCPLDPREWGAEPAGVRVAAE